MGAGGAAGFGMGSLLFGQGCLLTGSAQSTDSQLSLSPWVLGLKAMCRAYEGIGCTVLSLCLWCLRESRSGAEVTVCHIWFCFPTLQMLHF